MNPDNLNGITDRVTAIYADAEIALVQRIAASLEKGMDAPQWAVNQLTELAKFGTEARAALQRLAPTVATEIIAAIDEASKVGVDGADRDIADIPKPPTTPPVPAPVLPAAAVNTAAVTALATETVAALTGAHTVILRGANDAYRSIIAEVTGRAVTGAATRREITQQALNKFATEGIRGFTDRAGRNWHMDTYAEMATRTATLRAMHTGHTNRLIQRGYDLVVVSSHPNPAPVCKPYEGKILSLTGATPSGRHTFRSRTTDQPIVATVMASMAEAESKGLHHNNCRHRHSLFVPGVRQPAVNQEAGDKGYNDEQRLRQLERQTREWKRREAAAITPDEKRKAQAKVREKQALIRAHVDDTGVIRRRHREQLRTGKPDTTRTAAAPKPKATPKPTAPRTLTEAQGRQLGRATWRDYADQLDGPERDSLIEYTGNGYLEIGEYLREGLDTPGTLDHIRNIDKAIDNAPRVPEAIAVGRSIAESVFGIGPRATRDGTPTNHQDRVDHANSLIGRTFADDSFMSTTMASKDFPVEKNEARLILDVPAGTKALYVSGHDNINGAPHPRSLAAFGPEENELLVGRGARYQLTAATADPDGNITLYARITGHDPKEL